MSKQHLSDKNTETSKDVACGRISKVAGQVLFPDWGNGCRLFALK